jgi:hypothetical protein
MDTLVLGATGVLAILLNVSLIPRWQEFRRRYAQRCVCDRRGLVVIAIIRPFSAARAVLCWLALQLRLAMGPRDVAWLPEWASPPSDGLLPFGPGAACSDRCEVPGAGMALGAQAACPSCRCLSCRPNFDEKRHRWRPSLRTSS